MIPYRELNVNPKRHRTSDCSTRALTSTLRIQYEEAIALQCQMATKYCYGLTDNGTIERILKLYGYKKMKQPRRLDGTKYKVHELDELLTNRQMAEGVFVSVANHYTCIVDGHVRDIWDCRYKTVCNYWVKD